MSSVLVVPMMNSLHEYLLNGNHAILMQIIHFPSAYLWLPWSYGLSQYGCLSDLLFIITNDHRCHWSRFITKMAIQLISVGSGTPSYWSHFRTINQESSPHSNVKCPWWIATRSCCHRNDSVRCMPVTSLEDLYKYISFVTPTDNGSRACRVPKNPFIFRFLLFSVVINLSRFSDSFVHMTGR